MSSVAVPYEDYNKLLECKHENESVKILLDTEFTDTDCQMKAVKAILKIEENTAP